MTADRLEFYRNQMRGVPVAELGRMMWQVLLDATNEAARDERYQCAVECEKNERLFRDHAVMNEKTNPVAWQMWLDHADGSKKDAALIRARGGE